MMKKRWAARKKAAAKKAAAKKAIQDACQGGSHFVLASTPMSVLMLR
jgi:hypothetical protein